MGDSTLQGHLLGFPLRGMPVWPIRGRDLGKTNSLSGFPTAALLAQQNVNSESCYPIIAFGPCTEP